MSGHGHVTPNADGSKARCGGPAICSACAREAGVLRKGWRPNINTLAPYVRHIGHCGAIESMDPTDERCICGLRQAWSRLEKV